MQNPALQLGHLRRIKPFFFLEAVEITDQIPQRIAQPAIEVDLPFKDLGADP